MLELQIFRISACQCLTEVKKTLLTRNSCLAKPLIFRTHRKYSGCYENDLTEFHRPRFVTIIDPYKQGKKNTRIVAKQKSYALQSK